MGYQHVMPAQPQARAGSILIITSKVLDIEQVPFGMTFYVVRAYKHLSDFLY